MRILKSVVAILVMSAAPLAAAPVPDAYLGTWAADFAGRHVMTLVLTRARGGISGSMILPSDMDSNPEGGLVGADEHLVHRRLVKGQIDGDRLKLSFAETGKPDKAYTMRLIGQNAMMQAAPAPEMPACIGNPYIVHRVPAGAAVAADWDAPAAGTPANNPRMISIRDADEAERKVAHFVYDKKVRADDAERRRQTKALLDAGALHSGQDFEAAALVFQHSDKPQDYLLAHVLTMVAVEKGDTDAIWLSAATLDRYLMDIGQKQIFGTQYTPTKPVAKIQDPYNRTLVSDALRAELLVPSQSCQLAQAAWFKAR